jgi:rifampicin phosphotransferase
MAPPARLPNAILSSLNDSGNRPSVEMPGGENGRMSGYVLGFQEIGQADVAVVGGKGAHLGELSRIEGVRVPAGFCVTTHAFRRIMADAPSFGDRLDRLSRLSPDDRAAIRTLSAEVRRAIEGIAIAEELAAAITRSVARLGAQAAYAVRSSATAEDLPTASFAGQQDTCLNVVGPAAILRHVSRCWAALFTERAVTYRLRNGFGHRLVQMAVVVQRMVFPQAAGILFTADPVTSNRKVAYVEASFGLGETLVSGLVNADVFQVRDGAVVARTVGSKRLAIVASAAGGTHAVAIEPARREQPALTDAQVVRLAQLGRRIEAHFGVPQDIEWCLAGDGFQIVQSRPITTLFPIPAASDRENHVYVSVGHQQMMTDPMKPLGLSLWQLTTPRPMSEAGGRLFVDVTEALGSAAGRAGLLTALGRSDPLIGDALQTILERGDFVPALPDRGPGPYEAAADSAPAPIETDPAIVAELIERCQASIAVLKRDIWAKSGSALLDFILADVQELKQILFDPRSLQVIMAAMQATHPRSAADPRQRNRRVHRGPALAGRLPAGRPGVLLWAMPGNGRIEEPRAGRPGRHPLRVCSRCLDCRERTDPDLEGWLVIDESPLAGDIDVTRPSVARVYDFWLGGKDNFAVDRDEPGRPRLLADRVLRALSG